jgi:hypothetical protein
MKINVRLHHHLREEVFIEHGKSLPENFEFEIDGMKISKVQREFIIYNFYNTSRDGELLNNCSFQVSAGYVNQIGYP